MLEFEIIDKKDSDIVTIRAICKKTGYIDRQRKKRVDRKLQSSYSVQRSYLGGKNDIIKKYGVDIITADTSGIVVSNF